MSATTREPVEEMDVGELQNEWSDLSDVVHHHRGTDEEQEAARDRKREVWQELKSRFDAEPPECPECGARSWSQSVGTPKVCTECDLHLGHDEMDLIGEIDDYWLTIQNGEPGEQVEA